MTTIDALAELDDLALALPGPDDAEWSAPSRCGDWDVTDLVAHVVGVVWQQTEAFHRSVIRTLHQPSAIDAPLPSPLLPSALLTARDRLEEVLAVTDADPAEIVPLPWAAMPYNLAKQILVLEYGTHRNDLLHALGRNEPLPDRVVAVILPNLGAVLGALGRDVHVAAEAPVIRFESPSVRMNLAPHQGNWIESELDAGLECSTDDATLALFAMGRVRDSDTLATMTDRPEDLLRWFGTI